MTGILKYRSLWQTLICVLLIVVGVNRAEASKYDEYIDSLKAVIPEQVDTVKLASIVELDNYLASSAPKEIIPYLEEGLDIAAELDHLYYRGRMFNLRGTARYYLAEYDEAKADWQRAIEIFDQIPEDEYMLDVRNRLAHSTSLMNLGVVSRMRGEYSDALEYYQRSLEIRKGTGYKEGVAACYINIAKVYVDNKNDQRALEYYLKADEILEAYPNKIYQAGLLNNIGLIYKRKGAIDSAKTYFNRSLDLYKALDEPKRISQSYVNLGLLHKDMDDCEQALDYFSLALIINKEISDLLGMAWCYEYIGECYAFMRQHPEALDYYHRALSILEELKVAKNQLSCYEGLADIYARIGDYQNAYKFHLKFSTLNDSVYSDRLYQELAEKEAQYKSAEKEKQLELKDLELEKKTAQIEKNRVQKWALIIGFLLVVAVAVIFIQRFRIEARFHKKLESQNEELRRTYENLKATVISKEEKEVMIKEIHHRVKNNLQIISSLVNIQANSLEDKETQHMFREVQNRIISMSLLHEQLYKAHDLARVDVEEYLDVLIENLLLIYSNQTEIQVKKEISVESFGVDTLIPIGLLVNEVITNSMKYAFKGCDRGTIFIGMKHLDNKRCELTISDDGVGVDTEKLKSLKDSLGMELIETFVNQLDGSVEMSVENGTQYHIVFYPIDRDQKESSKHPPVPAV